MKYSLIVMILSISCACKAHAETAPVPIDALKWFEQCTQLTQPANGMIMDINCVDHSVQYCMTGRPKDEQLKCLADLSAHIASLSAANSGSIPKTIKASNWQVRSYKRRYLRLVEDGFDVCDASPIDEIPSDAWCDVYLNAGEWVEWRSLQRLALEVKQ